MKNYSLKKYLLLLIYCSLSIILIACSNSLGKKGEWNATYKQEFQSNCKAEMDKEKSLVKIDSIIILKICNCVTEKVEKEFKPLEMEDEESQTQMKIISTDCARDILLEN